MDIEPLEDEAVPNLFLKLVESGLPFRRNAAGLDVDGRGVPAKRLIENRLEREFPLVPLFGHPAGFERHGSRSPRVLESAARELLRIEILHVREGAARRAHVAPAVQPPSCAALDAVLERGQRVEIHQQPRAWKRGEVDVDQVLLDRPAGKVRPQPSPQ